MFELKLARPSDALELSRFAEKAFRETFANDNSPEDMALYTSENFSEEKQSAELAHPDRRIVLAWDAGQLIGYCQLLGGKTEACIEDPHPIKVERLYVDSLWHGREVGPRLLQEAIEQCQKAGFKTMWLGVWEKNFRALSFYKKWGFTPVGQIEFKLGNDPQLDLILSLSLN